LDQLQSQHDALREQNLRVLALGLAIDHTLKPIEEGIQIRKENEMIRLAQRSAKLALRDQEGTGQAAEDVIEQVNTTRK
jgi:hypothetical protein